MNVLVAAAPFPRLAGVPLRKSLLLVLVSALLGGSAAGLAWRRLQPEAEFAVAGTPLGLLTGKREPEYSLREFRLFTLAAQKVMTQYVDPKRVQAEPMLTGALDGAAAAVPELLWRIGGDGSTLTLRVGDAERSVSVPTLDGVPAVVDVLSSVAGVLDDTLPPATERRPIEEAMLNGALRRLDPHSVYFNADDFREMNVQNQGFFFGLGITIGIRDERLTVLYPLQGTPAWRAGLKPGDHIDRIGRESTVNMMLEEAVNKLRGPENTQVTIQVSDDRGMDREIAITRARIDLPLERHAYAGQGIGYIELLHFAAKTYDLLDAAIASLENDALKDGQGRLKGLVLDLRDNPGGYLEQAIQVSDKFLRTGEIVSTVGPGGQQVETQTAGIFGTESQLPVVVLVNPSSASASEIVAGALKNRDRALIMGARTFGKGSVQHLYEDGFAGGALKLTVAQYQTPGGVSIQALGVQPDVELRPARLDDENGVEAELFWEDYEVREEDRTDSFRWGNASFADGGPRFVFACEECFPDDSERKTEELANDHLTDPRVQAAKAVLLAKPSPDRKELLAAARQVLPGFFAEREQQLVDWLGKHGIDWTEAPANYKGKPKVEVQVEIPTPDGKLPPGGATPVTVRVTNRGNEPLHRVHGVTRGDFFGGREYMFGKIPPGQSREYSVLARPVAWLSSRTEEVTLELFADGVSGLPSQAARLEIRDAPRPRFAFSWHLLDDGSGGSKGNGDGLLQKGEVADVLVSVKNIGDGPTADLWRAEQGLLEPKDDKDKDGKADRLSGFVRLMNKSAESLFLEEGGASFSLQPGEETLQRLRFSVPADSVSDSVRGTLFVGDERFQEIVKADLDIPLFAPSGAIAEATRLMRSKDGAALAVRSGASPLTPPVAMLAGPVQTTGRLGDWLRVALPWGTVGWVEAGAVEPAGKGESAVAPTLFREFSPPVVTIDTPPDDVVSVDSIEIRGRIVDDQRVKDLVVYVAHGEDVRKIEYLPFADDSASADFAVRVPLQPGANVIEVRARDGADLLGTRTVGVYRESATAAAERPAAR